MGDNQISLFAAEDLSSSAVGKRDIYPSDLNFFREVKQALSAAFLEVVSVSIVQNSERGDFNSISISAAPNIFRGNNKSLTALLCRLYAENKKRPAYIAFPYSTAKKHISKSLSYTLRKPSGVPVDSADAVKDTGSLFITFTADDIKNAEFSVFLKAVFLGSFNFKAFGCCSKYKECSKAAKCVHQDPLYATACMYRKNLEQGKIFY